MEGVDHRSKIDPEQNRRVIMNAARKVFGERGYKGASVGEIAKEAGFSPAGLYVYFPSKEALFAETVAATFEELLDLTREVLDRSQDLDSLVRSFVETTSGFFERNLSGVRVMITESGWLTAHPEQIPKRIMDLHDQYVSRVDAAVRRLFPDNPVLPEMAALFHMVIMHTLLHNVTCLHGYEELVSSDSLITFVKGGLVALAEAAR